MSELTNIEVLICVCAADIVRSNGATEDMLMTLFEALSQHFKVEEGKRTVH